LPFTPCTCSALCLWMAAGVRSGSSNLAASTVSSSLQSPLKSSCNCSCRPPQLHPRWQQSLWATTTYRSHLTRCHAVLSAGQPVANSPAAAEAAYVHAIGTPAVLSQLTC
jgi:hypothetical protein